MLTTLGSWEVLYLMSKSAATGVARGLICKIIVLTLFFFFFNPRYRYGQLIEINSHSLFSKWFSEVSFSSLDCQSFSWKDGLYIRQTFCASDFVARGNFQS